MLNVIYSKSETNRNQNIINQIKESLGKNEGEVILLVPEQQVLEAERMTAGEGLVSFDFKVLSFRRLANEIFRCYGGLCEKYISPGASLVLMHRVLCELGGSLSEYGDIDLKDRSTITLISNAINEFKRAGISSMDLVKASEKLSHTEKLKSKLSDLAMIMSAYSAVTQNGVKDPMDDLTRCARLVNGTDFFKNVSVYVNSFDGFTGAELELLKLMVRDAKSVTVSLAMDLGDTSRFFDKIKRTDLAIRDAARDVGARVLHTKLPSESEERAQELEFLCEGLSDPDTVYGEENRAITVMPCKNMWDEAKFVASDILEKVKNGWDFSDFAIIMRSPESYMGILDAVLEGCNIPLHFSVRSDVKKHPEIRMISCALTVGSHGWKPDDVISYLRTGMTSLDLEKCDALEDYISLWKITGKNRYVKGSFSSHPDGFGHEFAANDLERLEYINQCKREFAEPLSAFLDVFDKGSARVSDICRALFEFLVKVDLKGQIENSINELNASGRLSDSEEKRQIWNTVINSLDSLVEVAGDMSVDIKSFSMLLDTVLDAADIGKIPQGIGDVIASGPLLIRKSGLRHVYMLGVNEGVFPAVATEDILLSDRERKRLLELGINVFLDREMRISDELYTFYRCLAMPKESITLTYLTTGQPASLVEDIMRIFAIEKPETFKITPQSTYTPFDAVRLASEMHSKPLFDELSGKLGMSTVESAMSVEEESLSIEISHKLFSSHTVLSQSKLDSYSMCPYAFYCKYILKLRERAVSEAGSNTVGSFVHEILEKFFIEFNGRDMRTVTEKESKDALDRVLSKYNCGIISEDSTSRERGLYTRIERLVRLLTDNLRREFSVSAFAPYTFEMPIGKSGEGSDAKTVKALEIPVDEDFSVSLCGYIDRVDVLKKGDDAYVRVIDYKTGKKEFKRTDMELGINLQMPLYLQAFCEDENLRQELAGNGELLPAGVLYFAAGYPGIDSEDVDVTQSDDVYEKAVRSIKRNGLVFNDEEIIFAMDPEKKGEFIPVKYTKNGASGKALITKEEFEDLKNTVCETVAKKAKGMRDGKISATPIKEGGHDGCEYCPMRPVCRRFGD